MAILRMAVTVGLALGVHAVSPVNAQESHPPPFSFHSPGIMDQIHGNYWRTPGHPRVALALSGGGARGLAQIGVLHALDEAGISIDVLCGVSMGAIVGGLYASGIDPDSLAVLARSVQWSELLQNTPPRAKLLLSQKDKAANWFVSIPLRHFRPQWPTGATSGQALYNYLSNLTQGATYRCGSDFDRLPVRFRAVATELVSGRRTVFTQGELAFAMRAAMAFPLAVSPLQQDSLLFVDGGLVDPLPVDLAHELSACPVVAVNTASRLERGDQLDNPYAMANQATTVMTAALLNSALDAADYVCSPDVGSIASIGFTAIDTLIALGYQEGRRTAQRIMADYHRSQSLGDSGDAPVTAPVTLAGNISPDDFPPQLRVMLMSAFPRRSADVSQLAESAVEQGWFDTISVALVAASPQGEMKWLLTGQRPPILRRVRLEGATVFGDSVLLRVMALPVEKRHGTPAIATALARIVSFYAARGYGLADIAAASLDSSGTLSVKIDEGPLAGIQLMGNRRVKSWVVLRSFPLKKGAPYNSRFIERGLTDLHASGLFEQVSTEVVRTTAGPQLRLKVTEKTTDAIRLGLHHDLEYQTEGFLELVNINLFGLGNELTVHAQYAPRRDWFFLRAKTDRIFRTYLTAAVTGYRQRHEQRLWQDHQQTGTFTTERLGARFFFGQNISRAAQMAINGDVERLDLSRSADSSPTRIRFSLLTVSARLDDLDNADFPTRGRRLSASLRWADKFLGGKVTFRTFEGLGIWAVPLQRRLTFEIRARFATAERHLPDYEQFTLGGRRSFMGLNDDEWRGDRLAAGSLGMRYRFFSRSYLMTRFDAGAVWEHLAHIDLPRDLQYGFGGGLEFDTPLGPLQILGGITQRGNSKFYFSFGYDL